MQLTLQLLMTIFSQTLFLHALIRLLENRHSGIIPPILGALATAMVVYPRLDLPAPLVFIALPGLAMVAHFIVLDLLRVIWPATPRQTG